MIIEGPQDFTMIGYLDDIDDVRIDKNDKIYIRLKNATDIPDSISSANDDVFDGYIRIGLSSIKSRPIHDDKTQSESLRREYIWEELSSLLFEVTPMIKKKVNEYIWWG